jgi:hypothetical protein
MVIYSNWAFDFFDNYGYQHQVFEFLITLVIYENRVFHFLITMVWGLGVTGL